VKPQGRGLDLRVLVVVGVALYLLALVIGAAPGLYSQRWHDWFGVATMQPLFADLHIVLAAGECARQGFDPLVLNPCDAHHRALPYPRIWALPGVLGLGPRFTIGAGVVVGLVFFAGVLVFIGRLRRGWHALVYVALLCSPPFMLGVERANVDLLVFVILAGATLSFARPLEGSARLLPYLAIVFAGILKLHPIVALVVVLREPLRRALATVAVCGGLFALYLLVTWDDLVLIRRGVVGWVNASHGSLVLPELLAGRAAGRLVAHVPAWMSLVPVVAAALIAWVTLRTQPGRPVQPAPSWRLDAFRAGAIGWGAAFIAGHNFDYRLVVLLLTLPQMLEWAETSGALSRSARVAPWVLVAACWLSWADAYLLLDEVLLWLLFGWYVHAVARTLPWSLARDPVTTDSPPER
jgi:hypothetical protein